jgi:hypothetical protein
VSRLRVLASGVDRMELSARGSVRADVLRELETAKLEAQRMREGEPYRFAGSGRGFLVQPNGRRAYPYVLLSRDMGLTVRENGELPPVRADLLSAWLHEMGAEAAASEVELLMVEAMFVVPPEVVVSRVDVYADVQGWELALTDAERFVSRARHRAAHTVGQRFTGLWFGSGGPVVARLYDKTAEIGRSGETWLAERWGERVDERPVWRLEFQFRRRALAEFEAGHPREVIARLGNLWEHGTREWLTLRQPTGQADRWRWPLDESWTEVQRVVVGIKSQDATRKRRPETDPERVVRFLQGHLTTWGALGVEDEIDAVWRTARGAVVRYLGERGRTFRDEVRHKRARLAFLRGGDGAGEPKARGEDVPPSARSGPRRGWPSGRNPMVPPMAGRRAVRRAARRARGEASTFLGRPPKDTTQRGTRGDAGTYCREAGDAERSERGSVLTPRTGEGARSGVAARSDGDVHVDAGEHGGDRGAGSPKPARRARTVPLGHQAERARRAYGAKRRRVRDGGGGGGGTQQRTVTHRPSVTAGCLARRSDARMTAMPRSVTSGQAGGRKHDGE